MTNKEKIDKMIELFEHNQTLVNQEREKLRQDLQTAKDGSIRVHILQCMNALAEIELTWGNAILDLLLSKNEQSKQGN